MFSKITEWILETTEVKSRKNLLGESYLLRETEGELESGLPTHSASQRCLMGQSHEVRWIQGGSTNKITNIGLWEITRWDKTMISQ